MPFTTRSLHRDLADDERETDVIRSSCAHILRSTLKRLAIQSRRKAQKPSPSFRARRGPPAMNPACLSSAMTGSYALSTDRCPSALMPRHLLGPGRVGAQVTDSTVV